MKALSEKQALRKLRNLKNEFRDFVKENYEHRAKDCQTCEVRGACCLDAHFVNVHITRLEAVLIREELAKLAPAKQSGIAARIAETVTKYALCDEGDTFQKTFACPLFEKGFGCLIHDVKPVPCIAHACYDRKEDLPPAEFQTQTEEKIERLQAKTYRQFSPWLPLPVWLCRLE